jgi:hypothetical protein
VTGVDLRLFKQQLTQATFFGSERVLRNMFCSALWNVQRVLAVAI